MIDTFVEDSRCNCITQLDATDMVSKGFSMLTISQYTDFATSHANRTKIIDPSS
jgi:hypothetical protein